MVTALIVVAVVCAVGAVALISRARAHDRPSSHHAGRTGSAARGTQGAAWFGFFGGGGGGDGGSHGGDFGGGGGDGGGGGGSP